MNSAFNLYVKDIEKYTPLDVEQEQVYGKILKSTKSSQEEKEQARHALINHNLKYVVKIATEYKTKPGWKQTDIMDLISAGNMGLMAAIDKYKWEVGRFLSYADSWIRSSIQRTRDSLANTIAKPEHLIKTIMHVVKVQDNLEQILGRAPTTAEIAIALDDTLEESKVEEILVHNQNQMMSMDDGPANMQDEDLTYGEVIPSNTKTPEEVTIEQARHSTLMKALDVLPPLNKRVIVLSFGLDADTGEKTYEEIADILFEEGYGYQGEKYTKQYISLLKLKGIELIRNNEDIMKVLQEYMEGGK